MSSVMGILGSAGGASGSGFQAPSTGGAVVNPSTQTQADTLYGGSIGDLEQQQSFVNALQAQNGIQNQSNVFNQLQGVANGTGPNPAQAQLAQATGANTANQAALMAGQRGAGSNVGLIARQAAQQGAANQQNAAGQAATLQAQQSLGALGQLGGLATNQVQQQANATTSKAQAGQSEQQNILNGIAGQNSANVGIQSNVNSGNAALANTSMQGQQKSVGSLLNGAGPLLSSIGAAEGGKIPHYADGGITASPLTASLSTPVQAAGPSSAIGQWINGGGATSNPSIATSSYAAPGSNEGADAMGTGTTAAAKGAATAGKNLFSSSADQGGGGGVSKMGSAMLNYKGGSVPALVSPGEKYLTPQKAKEVAEDGKSPMQEGKTIPGTPKVGGAEDDYANDTVPATLESGGIVIPRSVTQSTDAENKAIAFVKAHYAKGGMIPKKPGKK